jgi:hypothetical protein
MLGGTSITSSYSVYELLAMSRCKGELLTVPANLTTRLRHLKELKCNMCFKEHSVR